MSALENQNQQWYIEEIPAILDSYDESADEQRPAPVDGDLQNAGEPLIALGVGSMSLGAKALNKGNAAGTNKTAQTSLDNMGAKEPATTEGPWMCKTIAASSPKQSPFPRGGCSLTKVGSKYLLFGGADALQQHFGDVHCFDAATERWEKTTVGGTPPSPRSGHSAVALGESLVVYGGMDGQEGVTFNDLFELQTGSMEWISLQCTDLPPRNSHAAVLDGETMVIIGGASPEGQTSDVYTIDLSNRLDLSCQRVCCQPFKSENFSGQRDSGDAPAAREMHSACLYKVDSNEDTGATVLLMGGRSSCGVLREFFSLNTDSWSWKRLKDAPVPRCAHSACFIGDTSIMAIHGGWDGAATVANDLNLYDVQSGEWTTAVVSPTPVGRFAHAACSGGRDKLLVFGGVNPGEDLADLMVLTAP